MRQDHADAPRGQTHRAAVLRQPNQLLGFATAILEAPRNNEVLVRRAAKGVCRTDMFRDQLYSSGMPIIDRFEDVAV